HFSHCADIISLADSANVVGEVSLTLIKLCQRWIQTASNDYDVMVATTVDAEWAGIHQLVISTSGGHMLYTKVISEEPGGQFIRCHRGCAPTFDVDAQTKMVRVICRMCKSTTVFPRFEPPKGSLLTSENLIRIPFPPTQYPAQWKEPLTVR